MRDTIDKIVQTYFACVSTVPFEYKKKLYVPKPLIVSPLIFRGYDCPELCGACCHPISLDYLPSESPFLDAQERLIEISNKKYSIFSTYQNNKDEKKCHYMCFKDGRCQIHRIKPMPCSFELLKFTNFVNKSYLSTKLYGRGWALTRCTGIKKAMCILTPYSKERKEDIIVQLTRLQSWCDYFELPSKIPEVLDYVKTGPHSKPIAILPLERSSVLWVSYMDKPSKTISIPMESKL